MEKFNISWHYTNKMVNDLMKINPYFFKRQN